MTRVDQGPGYGPGVAPLSARQGQARPWLPLALTALLVWLGFWPETGIPPAQGAPLIDQQTLIVPVNKSRILDLREPIARVSVANPAIADILVINPKQIYINGKEMGATNMTLWDDQDQVKRQIALEVTQDLEAIKEKLYRALPGERIKVEAAKDSVILSGTASTPGRMESALNIARSYAGPEKVINLLGVGGAQQVMLGVKVAEVQRDFGKALDSNMLALYDGGSVKIGLVSGGVTGNSTYDSTTGVRGRGLSIGSLLNIDDTGLLASVASGNFMLDLALEAAESQGLVRLLAEPNLTTLSGQEADFLSGGQFPVQTVSGSDQTPSIEYKDYGVKLKFVPYVLDSGKISLKVNVSVSELGPQIPMGSAGFGQSVLTRGANATVEIPSGQTIAIAGMLDEKARDTAEKFPGLGDIPILGALFRSQEFQKSQTELVIFVTPRLAGAFDPQQVKLPTAGFIEPSNEEFYLMGKMSRQRSTPAGSTAPSNSRGKPTAGPGPSGAEGPFGHGF